MASVVVWCVVGVGAAVGAPGDLDATFGGGDGIVTTDVNGIDDDANAVVIDSEGRIVVAGEASTPGSSERDDFAVMRYTADGVLDTSFGTGGIVTTVFGNDAEVKALVVDSQGRIVVAGGASNGSTNDHAVARYTSAGVLDTSFGGGDGKLTTNIDCSGAASDDKAHAVAVDSQGRIVVAGDCNENAVTGHDQVMVMRYTSAGVLDTSFGGGDGSVLSDVDGSGPDEVNGMVVDSQDRIVVAGESYNGSNEDFMVLRYTSAGVLDTSFGGGDGIVTTDIGSGNDLGNAVVIDSQGRIVVAGESSNGGSDDFAVVRYTSAGVLDTSFGGGDGIVTTAILGGDVKANAVAIDSQGRIVAAGQSGDPGSAFSVVRYTSAGVVDTSFGGGDGSVTTSVSLDDEANGVAIDSQDRIVVVGETDPQGNEDDDFGVVRYLSEHSVPGAPTNVVALSSQGGKAKLYGQGGRDMDGLVTVSWATPSNCWDCVSTTGSPAITDYVVEYSSDSGASWSTVADGTSAAAAVMVTGLSNGVGYVFRVSATNSVGTGSVSGSSASVTPAPVLCTITGTPGDDVLVGTGGPDHICGLGGDDTIYGKGGNDVIDGGPGNDTLFGGTGKDRIFGRGGADVLKGGRNNDKMYGNGDRDRLYGQAGNDRLVGGSSRDKLYGQGGRDKLYGRKARDLLVGGAMKDTLDGGSQKDTAKTPGPDVLVSIEIVVP